MKKKSVRVVTAALPMDLIERVEAIGERIDRSKSWMNRHSLSEWIIEQERHHAAPIS